MDDIENLSFEQAFQQLEEVVQSLERGDLTLDESLGQFERGMLLARFCEGKLDLAEQRVSELTDAGGLRPLVPGS